MAKRALVMGILVVLLFSAMATSTHGAGVHKNDMAKKSSNFGQVVEINGVRYTTHDVIRINNNTDFANQASAEGWPGNGTQGNPYIISGYDIDAHGAGDAIYIGNTTVYFVVENCYMHNASYHSWPYFDGDGITLYSVTNGAIANNSIYNSGGGIYLWYSSSNTIANNAIYNNRRDSIYLDSSSSYNTIANNSIYNNSRDGIDLETSSSYNIIANNSIYNNRWDGIDLLYSSSNTLVNNSIDNNSGDGIYLLYSSSNTIANNTMENNGIFLYNDKSTFTTQKIDTSNTVNGKPVYYYKNANMDNATVPHNAGEVILGNVSWLTISNLNLSNSSVGIEIGYSAHITVKNNSIYNARYGIYLLYSSSNTVANDYIYNARDGIDLLYSSSNTLANNSIYNNSGDAIYLWDSSSNTLANNSIDNNSGDAIYLGYSSSNTIINNSIDNNSGDGIYLRYSSSYNTLANNSIDNNSGFGIRIYTGSRNLIYNNAFYYNHGSGDVYNSSHIQAYDDGSNNFWNSTTGIGNYWYDWANNNNTNDQNHDGIVDWPYNIAGSAGAKDYYPLKNKSLSNVLSHPLNLQAVTGDGYINLTWKPPAYGSDTVIGYKIYRNGTLIATVPASRLYYNDTNISNGITYTYYVTAVNSVGESEPSNEVQATPGQAVPELQAFWLPVIALLLLLGLLQKREK